MNPIARRGILEASGLRNDRRYAVYSQSASVRGAAYILCGMFRENIKGNLEDTRGILRWEHVFR